MLTVINVNDDHDHHKEIDPSLQPGGRACPARDRGAMRAPGADHGDPDARERKTAMQYMMLFRETKAERAKHKDPAAVEAYFGGWSAYIGALARSGAMMSGNGLLPPETGTLLRVENGSRQVDDRSFADAEETVGGYVVIEVPDLDAALEWAAKAPCAVAGSVEIRPILPPPPSA
jgi:hypothetical protein